MNLESLVGKELLMFDDMRWVYDIEAGEWVEVIVPQTKVRGFIEGSSNGLVCITTGSGTDPYVFNPLEQTTHRLPSYKGFGFFTSLVLHADPQTSTFKVFTRAECKRGSRCKVYEVDDSSMVGVWRKTAPVEPGHPLSRKVTNGIVANKNGKIYLVRYIDEDYGSFIRQKPQGVLCYDTSNNSWETITLDLPRGFRYTDFLMVFQLWMVDPFLMETADGSQLYLFAQACVEEEPREQYLGVWKLDLEAEFSSRQWYEVTRLPESMLAEFVGDSAPWVNVLATESKLFLRTPDCSKMAALDLQSLEWFWLPDFPSSCSYQSGCVYKPSLEFQLPNVPRKRTRRG